MPIATLQTPKGTDYKLMTTMDDFIIFRGQVPVEVDPNVANLLRNRPDFLVIDGTMGVAPKGMPPKKVVTFEPIEVKMESEDDQQNVAGIPHQPNQPKFERLMDKVG